jgi:hypothetical protein
MNPSPRSRSPRAGLAVVSVWALAAMMAPGAASAEEPRLRARLQPTLATAIERLVGEARAERLPVDPLIGQALQGASKGASPERILAVVGQHLDALRAAREALGTTSSEAELVAGAGAILSGVARDSIGHMRAARPSQSLVVPLVVLADLVARRVPPDAASAAVMSAARAGARDQDLLRLRERVEQDIQAGVSPAAAAELRTRALLLKTGATTRTTATRGRRP